MVGEDYQHGYADAITDVFKLLTSIKSPYLEHLQNGSLSAKGKNTFDVIMVVEVALAGLLNKEIEQ
jgi:hypothetical protein